MRERKKALERLVAVKTQLHRLEEVRLVEIETSRDQARRDRDAMIDLLDQIGGNRSADPEPGVQEGRRGGARRGAAGRRKPPSRGRFCFSTGRRSAAPKSCSRRPPPRSRGTRKSGPCSTSRKRSRARAPQASRKPGASFWSRRLDQTSWRFHQPPISFSTWRAPPIRERPWRRRALWPIPPARRRRISLSALNSFHDSDATRDCPIKTRRCLARAQNRPSARRRSDSKACC